MKLGLGFTGAPHPVREKIRYVKHAETKGFHSVWIAEDYFLRDGVSTIGSLATVTEKIKLATGVVNPYTRHPVLIAMTMATLDELSNGRMILGLGAADKHHVEQMGMKYERPLVKIKESIRVIRQLLTGEKAAFAGATLKINNIQLGSIPVFETFGLGGFKPVRADIPIYIAAIGPKMLQLGGEIADGVILPICTSPSFVQYAVENVKTGAAKTGRDPKEVNISAFVTFSVAGDSEKAKDDLRGLTAALISFGTSSLSNRANKKYLEPFDEEDIRPIRKTLNEKGLLAASKLVSDEMVNNFAVVGTPDQCLQRLREYEAAGLDLAEIFPMCRDVAFAIDVAAEYLGGHS